MSNELIPITTDLVAIGQAAEVAAKQTDHLSEFLNKKRPETLRRYQFNLNVFQAFLESAGSAFRGDLLHDIGAWQGMNASLLRAFQIWLVEKEHYKIRSANGLIYTIRAFCGVAALSEVISQDELSKIKLVQGYRPNEAENMERGRLAAGLKVGIRDKQEWVLLTPEQVKKLLQYCQDTKSTAPTKQRHAVRDTLLILLAFKLGLRVGEIAQLRIDSLVLERSGRWIVTFDRPKTYLYDQRLEVRDETLKAWLTWLDIRKQETDQKDAPLFNAEREQEQKAILTGTITHRLQALGKRVLNINILNTHAGRHYWTDDTIQSGTDIGAFTQAGGWKTSSVPLEHYRKKRTIANAGVKSTSLDIGESK